MYNPWFGMMLMLSPILILFSLPVLAVSQMGRKATRPNNPYLSDEDRKMVGQIHRLAKSGLVLGLLGFLASLFFSEIPGLEQNSLFFMMASGAVGIMGSFFFWLLQLVRRISERAAQP
jgi:hypothetical protein